MGPIPPDNVEGMSSPTSVLRARKNANVVAVRLQEVIQDLFEVQSTVHGYLGPQTQQVLVHKVYNIFLPERPTNDALTFGSLSDLSLLAHSQL